MSNLLKILFFILTGYISYGQYIQLEYGGSFTGFGDLQGRYMSVGYRYDLKRNFSLYGSYTRSSMSGNKLSYLYAGQAFIGLDYLSKSVIDPFDFFNNGKISNEKLLNIGSSYSYDPPYSMINESHLNLGININLINKGKFRCYAEGNGSLVKLEVIGIAYNSNFLINKESWVNDPNIYFIPDLSRQVGIFTQYQEHFLDFGFGYGIGLDYALYDFLSIGANAHYNQYVNSAQNFLSWGMRFGLKL